MRRVMDFFDAISDYDRRGVRVFLAFVIFWTIALGYLYWSGLNDQSLSEEQIDSITERVRESLCRDGTASSDLCLEWQKEQE